MNPYAPQPHPSDRIAPRQNPIPPFRSPQYPAPQYPAPQYPAAQYQAPRHPTPQYAAARHQVPIQQAPTFRVPPVTLPPRRSLHPALIVSFGVLVVALVVTSVLLVQNASRPAPTGAGPVVPTAPIVLSTAPTTQPPTTTTEQPTTEPSPTEPTTTEPTTTEPSTTEPTTTTEPSTTEPTTSQPTTTRPTTTRPTASTKAVVVREATTAAQAWARAVSTGDVDGVLARSCRQDIRVYDSGDLTNPGELQGRYSFTFQKVISASGAEQAAIVRFGISPKLGSLTTLESYVTLQSGRWLVCISVTKLADL